MIKRSSDMEIKRIGVLSAAKILGSLYAGLGLVAGLFSACAGLAILIGLLAEAEAELAGVSSSLFLAGLCVFPIFYGLIGAIIGAIGAVLYNLFAGIIGGIEIEFAESKRD